MGCIFIFLKYAYFFPQPIKGFGQQGYVDISKYMCLLLPEFVPFCI